MAWLGIELTREAGRIASLWPPNGIVLAVLLTVRKRFWLAYLGAGLTGNIVAGIVSGDAWWLALTLSLYNYLEIAFIAVCLRPNDAAAIRRLASRMQLIEFFCLAFGGSILSAGLAACTLHFSFDVDISLVLRRWFLADFLGLAIITPLAMAVHQELQSEKPTLPTLLQNAAIATLIAAISIVVFAQQTYPLLFLLLPPILLAVQQCGSIGAAGGMGILAAISVGFTVVDKGPFNLIPGSDMEERVLVMQFFLLTTSLLALWANARRYERLQLEQALRDSEANFRLLAERASDVVSRVTADGVRRYVSPAALRVYGAAPEDLVGSKLIDWIDPRDRPALEKVIERLLDGSWDENAKLEYRVRHPNGAEVWIEASARPLRDATGNPDGYVSIARDITERRNAEERQALLVREVDHRAKNALAVALSLVRLAPREDAKEFAQSVEGRIAAMARAHSLLAKERWGGVDLLTLAKGELAAHAERLTLSGPAVRVGPDAAQPVAMLLHELSTNATKYGALSSLNGKLSLSWEFNEADARLSLTWQESGGPRVNGPPTRSGFGSRLLTTLIERQLGGSLSFNWAPSGLEVSLTLSTRYATPAGASWYTEPSSVLPATQSMTSLSSINLKEQALRVLVVEDDALLAMELETALRALGCHVIGPARTLAEAVRVATIEPALHAAILDVNICGEMVFPVADILTTRNVPLVFATGYGSAEILEERAAAAVAILRKPYPREALASALIKALHI